MLYGMIMSLEVFTNLFPDSSLPFDGVKLFQSIQMLLFSFEGLVELKIVQFVMDALNAKNLADKGFVLLREGNAVVSELSKEEPFAQATILVRGSFLLEQSIVFVGHFIEKLICIDSQLIDDLLYDRLHLHESVHATAYLLVDQILENGDQLGNRYLARAPLVEEREHQTSLIEGNCFAQTPDNLTEFRSAYKASLVCIDKLNDLPHLKRLLMNGISDVIQDVQNGLTICGVFLSLTAFAHCRIQEALAAQFVGDVS